MLAACPARKYKGMNNVSISITVIAFNIPNYLKKLRIQYRRKSLFFHDPLFTLYLDDLEN